MTELESKVRADLRQAAAELAQLEARCKELEWRVRYLRGLLSETDAGILFEPDISAPVRPLSMKEAQQFEQQNHEEQERERFGKMTIAEAAYTVLKTAGRPLSAMDVARKANENGYGVGTHIERLRSHFSAVLSSKLKEPNSLFWKVERGQIGLSEWKREVPIDNMRVAETEAG